MLMADEMLRVTQKILSEYKKKVVDSTKKGIGKVLTRLQLNCEKGVEKNAFVLRKENWS